MRRSSGASVNTDAAHHLPVETDLAAADSLEPGDAAQRGGLAAAARAEQAGDVAALEREREILEHRRRSRMREPPGGPRARYPWRDYTRSRENHSQPHRARVGSSTILDLRAIAYAGIPDSRCTQRHRFPARRPGARGQLPPSVCSAGARSASPPCSRCRSSSSRAMCSSRAVDVWQHLVDTVLADYVRNTVWLALGVGAGVMIVGVGTAWLVTMCRFPGSRTLDWALILPLAMPAYVHGLRLHRLSPVRGPAADVAARADRLGARATTGFPTSARCGGAITVMIVRALSLRLPARARGLPRAVGRRCWRSGARSATAPGAASSRIALAAGASRHRRRHVARADGDAGGLRHRLLLRACRPSPPASIARGFRWASPVAAAQLSAVLLGFVAVCSLAERLTRGRARYHDRSPRRRLPSRVLRGWRAGCLLRPASRRSSSVSCCRR